MLSDKCSAGQLEQMLLSKEQYRPYPPIDDRPEWEKLPGDVRRSVIAEGEKYAGFEWPHLTASMYMEFLQNGNRTRYDGPYHLRRRAVTSLALAECVENKGRFLKELIDGIWLICEESSWVISAHNRMFQHRHPGLPDPDVQPGIDLFAAETGNLFAWLHALLKPALDAVSPLIDERIVYELRRRILNPYLEREDLWWMGFRERDKRLNNWTPWCTSNCLNAFLLAEPDERRRLEAVRKAMRSIDRYLAVHPADGGCDEGPGYWNKAGGSLFDCLELLCAATGGKFQLYDEPIVRAIGRYIYNVHIHNRYFLNFADGPHQITVEGSLVYRYGKRIGDPNMMALGTAVHAALGPDGWSSMKFLSMLRVLPALFQYSEIESDRQTLTFRKDVWMDGIQVMAARETDRSDRGLYAAMKGGHNLESHNHNDVGHFVVYADGMPVLIDVGVEEYSAKTFSDRRYDIWTMQSGYHSVPTINGHMQRDGISFRAEHAAYVAGDNESRLTLELAAAYPREARIRSWRRSCSLRRLPQASVELAETYAFEEGASPDFSLNLMTCCRPEAAADGCIVLYRGDSAALVLEYDGALLAADFEPIPLEDRKLRHAWGERLYRIVLRPLAAKREGGHTILFRQPQRRSFEDIVETPSEAGGIVPQKRSARL